MLITWLSDFFRAQRLSRRSTVTVAFVQRLETRCLLTIRTPVVLAVVPATPPALKVDGSVDDVELRIVGLNFSVMAGEESAIYVNNRKWDTTLFSENAIIGTPQAGSSNGLKWGSNEVFVLNGDTSFAQESNHFLLTLLPPAIKVTAIETNPSPVLRGKQGFVIAVEGENFTNQTRASDSSTLQAFSYQILERSRTHLLIGVDRSGSSGTDAGHRVIDLDNDIGRGASIEYEIHNPTPVITSVTPDLVVLESNDVISPTIIGSGFLTPELGQGSVVVITRDGDESQSLRITPNQVTDTQVRFSIQTRLLQDWTGFSVAVVNRASNQGPNEGESSNRLHVSLETPQPFITTLSDLFALTGGADKPVQVEGRNFSNPIVRVGSTPVAIAAQSANVLTVTIPAALQTTTGIKPVTVENQDPDGNVVSNAKPFGVVDSSNAIKLSENSKVLNGFGTSLIVDLVNSRPTPTFQPGAVVKWNGVIVGSVGGTEAKSFIAATIPASLMANPEVASITIENANGAVFGPVAYFLKSPRPTRTGVQNIGTVTVGPDAVLTLRGTNFFPGSRVILNGGGPELPTTFTDSQTLVVTIPANRIPLVPATDNRVFSLTVENPAPREGGTPDVWDFRAIFPTPTLTGGSAPVVTAGAPLQTIMVSGTGFLDGLTKAYWDDSNVPLTTRFLSDSQLEVDLPASLLAVGGSHLIRVATNKGNGIGLASNQLGLDVLHPKPTLSAIESTWAPTRSSQPLLNDPTNASVTLRGTGFTAASSLRLEGPSGVQLIPLTSFPGFSDRHVTISLPLEQSAGNVGLSIVNPEPGGGTSNPMTFVLARPQPRVTSVVERTFGGGISAGSPNTQITVAGFDFVEGANVIWDGVKLATTFVSASRLDATVPAELLRTASTAQVTISGGGAPASAASRGVQLSSFFASISSISPDSAPPGSGSQVVTVNGNYFLNGAVAQWNGQPRATTYVSGQQVTMTLTAADLAQAGSGVIRVVNPDGSTFGTRNFSVRNPLPVIVSTTPAIIRAGSVVAPNFLSLTITGTGFGTDPFGMAVDLNTPDNPNNFRNQVAVVDSPTQLRVSIPADQIATARTAQIQIRPTGGGVSNRFDLVIDNGGFSIVSTSANKNEGTSGSTQFSFTVTRGGVTTGAGSVNYAVTGSGASPATADDFTGNAFPTGTVNFAPNQSSQVVTINVAGNTTIEPTETFTVTLSKASGGILGSSTATGTIINDDAAFSIAAAVSEKAEGSAAASPFTFTVTRTGATSDAASVKFAVAGSGSNPANITDFGTAFPTGTVNFAAGAATATVAVNVMGDTTQEADEGFTVTLNTPVGGVIGATASASGSILNDDSMLTIAAVDANNSERNTGTTAFSFRVIRGGVFTTPATVMFAVTPSGNGANAADFVGSTLPNGTLNFAAGEISKTITFETSSDTIAENDEGFIVTLSNPSAGVVLGTSTATGSILNDDPIAVDVRVDNLGKLTVTDLIGLSNSIVVTRDAGRNVLIVTSTRSELFRDGVGTPQTSLEFPATGVTGIVAKLGNGDDLFNLSTISLPSLLEGGIGNDSLTGGLSNDTITGSDGTDVLVGGAGTGDVLSESTTTNLMLSATQLSIGLGGAAVVESLSGFERAILFGGGAANVLDASVAGIPVTLFGGGGNDVLLGGSQPDNIDGQAGNDTLTGGGGNDTLNGGAGVDGFRDVAYTDVATGQIRTITLSSTSLLVKQGTTTLSADSLLGFEFADLTGGIMRDIINASGFTNSSITTLSGGGGNDVITGTPGADMIFTVTGADSINGGAGGDTIFSGTGNDTINGGAGADNLNGQNGNDLIAGDADNDVLIGGAGIDTLTGGLGNDFLSGQSEAGLLSGGDGNDTLQGATAGDTLNGEAGDDRLYGLQGDDVINAGDGADSLLGASGNDSLSGGAGADTLQGDVGNDTLDGGADSDRINEVLDTNFTVVGINLSSNGLGVDSVLAIERIQLNGGAGNNLFDGRQATVPVFLSGGAGNDTLLGGSKADGVSGGDGDDVLFGGAGTDVLDGGAGTDYVYEQADTNFTMNGVTITSSITGSDTPTTVERIVLIGGIGANKLDATLASAPVVLIGGRGNDTLLGGSAADTLSGGNRNDATVSGGDGTDSLDGGVGSDVLENDPVDAKVIGAGDITVSDVFTLLPSWIDSL